LGFEVIASFDFTLHYSSNTSYQIWSIGEGKGCGLLLVILFFSAWFYFEDAGDGRGWCTT
jgi:hypothetical protein